MSDLETVKIRPHNDRVLIQRKQEEYEGKIIIPDTAKKLYGMEGEVIAIGPNCKDVKPGDCVFFGQYSFTEFKKEGRRVIVREADILAVRDLSE